MVRAADLSEPNGRTLFKKEHSNIARKARWMARPSPNIFDTKKENHEAYFASHSDDPHEHTIELMNRQFMII